jgi:hypothetical protein
MPDATRAPAWAAKIHVSRTDIKALKRRFFMLR